MKVKKDNKYSTYALDGYLVNLDNITGIIIFVRGEDTYEVSGKDLEDYLKNPTNKE